MKWITAAISSQNLYLKLCILCTGIVMGMDSSLKQLLMQIALILLYLLCEISLFKYLFQAFRRILPFLSGYWLFATLFSQSFPSSVLFSVQIVYLLLVMVAVFGKTEMSTLALDSKWIRKSRHINVVFYYCFATMQFLDSFSLRYKEIKLIGDKEVVMNHVSEVIKAVLHDKASIHEKVTDILSQQSKEGRANSAANFTGLLFLAVLVLLHGV
ncbi:MAG: hypothetical protein PHO32_10610 [Candidatus Cloacimonetes bacterium]|nr:hypothetical protein [Candidatus Cloacimonadota bacterium]